MTADVDADVVVAGAGLTGLSIAYQLAKAGKNVVVLEGRSRGAGQTGRYCPVWDQALLACTQRNLRTRRHAHHKCVMFIAVGTKWTLDCAAVQECRTHHVME